MSAHAIDVAPEHEPKSALRRVVDVARIQTVNINTLVVWPVAILAIVFSVNVLLFALIGDVGPDNGRFTGALMSIYIVVGVTHLQTITQLFPFALGISITRRTFYTGTALVVIVQSMAFGLLATLLELLERATDGWWYNLRFFGLPFLVQSNFLLQWLVFTVPFIALSAIFIFGGVVFKRWGQSGVFIMSIGAGVLAAAAVVLITMQQWWTAIGQFFTGQSTLALVAGYPLIIAVVAAAGGFLMLRRATP